ncbi:bifunctional hydroxymethylpyrimidine kinase/phosphomethylpyrimidine kinase [Pedobacter immunditicola]|uniref:bifunctional hydroxymethylpyrimidine kinase/phosphomethylpyrimidine kinase n=1 Tax=Pedobacter immunditicola TaxID=3133440 RepID=UPI00309A0394
MGSKYPSVLTIAGSDCSGGAGIQADLKTFAALGCYGTSAITAITVQNTVGVQKLHKLPPELVKDQIIAVMDDIQCAAIKIGMIHNRRLTETIAPTLKEYKVPIIFDPVMVATSGDLLLEADAVDSLKKVLFPLCALVTPNLDEASVLTSMEICSLRDMENAAWSLIEEGCKAVLIKGGHLKGTELFDLYLDHQGEQHIFSTTWIDTNNTHGTGCTLSSAIAAYMARGLDLLTAIEKARQYVHKAILYGKNVKTGKGHGPLNHSFDPEKMQFGRL